MEKGRQPRNSWASACTWMPLCGPILQGNSHVLVHPEWATAQNQLNHANSGLALAGA